MAVGAASRLLLLLLASAAPISTTAASAADYGLTASSSLQFFGKAPPTRAAAQAPITAWSSGWGLEDVRDLAASAGFLVESLGATSKG